MFDPKKYAEHAQDNEYILGDDFTKDEDLLEKVNHDGEINDVRYTVSTGCMVMEDTIDYIDEEEAEKKNGILEIGFLG
jgi:predicted nucleic acid-binding Zn finger protein